MAQKENLTMADGFVNFLLVNNSRYISDFLEEDIFDSPIFEDILSENDIELMELYRTISNHEMITHLNKDFHLHKGLETSSFIEVLKKTMEDDGIYKKNYLEVCSMIFHLLENKEDIKINIQQDEIIVSLKDPVSSDFQADKIVISINKSAFGENEFVRKLFEEQDSSNPNKQFSIESVDIEFFQILCQTILNKNYHPQKNIARKDSIWITRYITASKKNDTDLIDDLERVLKDDLDKFHRKHQDEKIEDILSIIADRISYASETHDYLFYAQLIQLSRGIIARGCMTEKQIHDLNACIDKNQPNDQKTFTSNLCLEYQSSSKKSQGVLLNRIRIYAPEFMRDIKTITDTYQNLPSKELKDTFIDMTKDQWPDIINSYERLHSLYKILSKEHKALLLEKTKEMVHFKLQVIKMSSPYINSVQRLKTKIYLWR